LACSRDGRVAFLTNVLELRSLPEAKTRGDLPASFLKVYIYMYIEFNLSLLKLFYLILFFYEMFALYLINS